MARILPLVPPSSADCPRLAVGIAVASDCSRLAATVVACDGHGLELQPKIVDGMDATVPEETSGLFRRLAPSDARPPPLAPSDAQPPPPAPAEALAALRAGLAELQAAVVDSLLDQAGIAPAQVFVIGVQDPGLWSGGKGNPTGYLGLCDAARLAERTGLSVVDAFPARDVALGGQGGPLAPLAEWLLLRDPPRNRALVDLGRTTRLSYLPGAPDAQGQPRVTGFDVGPGMRLADLLVGQLTGGEEAFDPGGRYSVQGRRIQELIDRWMADPYFRRPLPRWNPRGVRPDRFVLDALQRAVQRGWSIRDLLCTATHFVAESVARAVRQRMSDDAAVDQIILTGGGRQNGMLRGGLAGALPGMPIVPIEEVGIECEAIEPACSALLAMFYLDQVPAARPEITGTASCRVLGRFTPGSSENWERLAAEIAKRPPILRPLRAAG